MTLESLIRTVAPPAVGDLAARADGVMIGLAVGNMLGVPVEFEMKTELARRYPDGLREIDPALKTRDWDDDLAQAILLAESIRDVGTIDLPDLAERIIVWRRENGAGIGLLTADVIDLLEAGEPAEDAARIAWERSGQKTAGNGAVMRCAPVALRWWNNPDALVAAGRRSAELTHFDPRCSWSTAVVLAALAMCLRGGEPHLPSLAQAAAQSGAPREVTDAIHDINGVDIDDVVLDGSDQGYTLKAMQVGLWCLSQPLDFEEALVTVLMQGGDTDTNCAVAGAVMGARAGVDAIPTRWAGCVPQSDYILDLARVLRG